MAKAGGKRAPKTIAGVTVPEALRNSDWITGVVHSPVLREALAAALVAGAAAAAAVLSRQSGGAEKAMKAGAESLSETASAAGGLARNVTEAAVGAVAGMAIDAAHNLLSGSSSGKGSKRGKGAQAKTTQPKAAQPASTPAAAEKRRPKAR